MNATRIGGFRRAENLWGFLLVLPTLTVYAVMMVYPLMRAMSSSLFRDSLLLAEREFVGLKNFLRIFSDPSRLRVLRTSFIFMLGATALAFVLGLIWAIVLNQPFRGRKALRALSLMPWVFPSTVTAFLWAWMFDGKYGVINWLLTALGIIKEPIVWMAYPKGAMGCVIFARVWVSIAWYMSLFLAGLQSLPEEQVEAARVDGAGNLRVLWNIALPHLSYTMLVAAILGALGNLQLFDLIYVMTGGGPVGATKVLSISVYELAFQEWNTGLASAMGVIWMLVAAIPAFFYLRFAVSDVDKA
jgi:multiple sugar transport system permease protein